MTPAQAQPGFSKSFAPGTIGPGSVSTLTFTIDNMSSGTAATDLAFTDTLPAGVVIADPVFEAHDCGGGGRGDPPVLSAPGGGSTISFSGGSLAAGASCTVSVDVTGSTPGGYDNVSGDLTSSAGNSGSAAATLTISGNRPGFTKSFSPNLVQLGGTTTLTFTLDNSAHAAPVTNLAFTDNLPAGLEIASPANVSNTCFGILNTPEGSGTISFFSGSVDANSSCAIALDVTATAVGRLDNRTSDLTSNTGNSGKASDSLTVVVDQLALVKSFVDDPAFPGGTTTLEFSLSNLNRFDAATGITFTDDLDATLSGLVVVAPLPTDPCGAGSTLAGTSLLMLTGGTLAPGENCTFQVTLQVPAGAAPGHFLNSTSDVTADLGGRQASGAPATDDLVVDIFPVLTKTFLNSPVGAGETVDVEFTITNTSSVFGASDIAFTDNLSAFLAGATPQGLPMAACNGTLFQLNNVPSSGDISLFLSGASLGASASCNFTVTLRIPAGTPGGSFPNTTSVATATVDGATRTGPPATDTLDVIGAPALTKAFIDDPVDPGATVTLEFTLAHQGQEELPPGDAMGIAFTDDLDAALSGLEATGLPQSDVCGAGSTISGTSSLSFTGGNLAPGETCSFQVTLQVPAGAAPGFHTNTTSAVTATVNGLVTTGNAATDDLAISGLELTKAFIGDPVLPGSTVTLRFTLTNDNPDLDATSVSFQDDLAAALPGLAASGLPQNDVCGTGSSIIGTTNLSFSGDSLAAGASCTFDVTVQVPAGTASDTYLNATSPLSATMGDQSIQFGNATDDLVVDANLLDLTKSFTDDPANPGGTVTLEFTITNLSATETITDIAFTDDLDDALAGLVSESGTQTDVCGAGSQLAGTNVLSITGGTLAPGASCTFSAALRLPDVIASGGSVVNVTSQPTGSAGGLAVEGAPASDGLSINLLAFSKAFDGPARIGGSPMLTFTIENLDSSNAANGLAFTDVLDGVIPGLVATGLPQNDVCGSGSQLGGTSLLTFSGGSLGPGASCSFDVTVSVPADAAPGNFLNTTSELSANGLPVAAPATAELIVVPPPDFSKTFARDPVAVGAPVALTFTIDNTGSSLSATGLDFTDNLPAGLTVATPPDAVTTCTGGTLGAVAGSGIVSYSGGSVVAGASCTISVDVVATAAGNFVNTTGDLTSSLGNSGTATATVQGVEPFTLVESEGTTSTTEDGTTDTFTLVLNLQPQSDVVLLVSSNDTDEVAVSPMTLTFTNANWDTPQTVTVTGVDDTLEDGDQNVLVTLAVDDANSDDAFDGLSAAVDVTNADNDDDGVDPAVEDAAPNGGDGNGDGIPDSEQATVASLPNATTGDYLTVVISGEGCVLVDVASLDAGALPPDQILGEQGLITLDYPQGLIRFAAPCPQAGITILFHQPPASRLVRKYGPTIADDPGSVDWYDFSAQVSFGEQTIDGKAVTVLSYSLSDGQLGDDDTDPARAEDWLVDPIGVAQRPPSALPISIPTLTGWGLGLLALLMGLIGGWRIRHGCGAEPK